MSQHRRPFRHPICWGTAAAIVLGACSNDDTVTNIVVAPPDLGHPEVVLRDVQGDPLPKDSREPYSPRMTCGRCHDVDTIADAYHFQQGRIDALGRIEEQLTKPWEAQVAVLSPGMFGKW